MAHEHISLERRAANAITNAVTQTESLDGLIAIKLVIENLKDDIGFEVDAALNEVMGAVNNKIKKLKQ